MKRNKLHATLLALAVGLPSSHALAEATAPVTIVTASPFSDREDLQSLQPVSILTNSELRLKEGTNIGSSLSGQLGVQSSAYGAGAGRPIIRGMDSSRVRITESGLGTGDVSAASPDHRVAADTYNSRQVEVLRGPATLLYGSGAVGGLVNIVSDRVPVKLPQRWGAQLNLRGATGNDESLLAFGWDTPIQKNMAFRIEGFHQHANDYELPNSLGKLTNSATEAKSLSVGSTIFARNYLVGLALQRYESEYGIPNPEEPVTIKLKRNRIEGRAEGDLSSNVIKAFRLKWAWNDYSHTEFEPDGTAGATFKNQGLETRLELPHVTWAGWEGVLGVQLQQAKTQGKGEGNLPLTQGQALAFFVVEEKKVDSWRYELGLRAEQEKFRVREDDENGIRKASRNFSLLTLSGGATWNAWANHSVSFLAAYSQRAPSVEELYFEGAHPATFAYEIGNSQLKKEQSTNFEVRFAKDKGWWRWQISAFQNRLQNYIYGSFDGSTTLVDGESWYNLFYRQDDARFRGVEAQLSLGGTSGWQTRLWGDWVRAQLTSGVNAGQNVPRLAPARLGLDWGYKTDTWLVQVSGTKVAKQNRVSNFDLREGVAEQPTQGYTWWDLSVAYQIAKSTSLYLIGKNLTDVEARVHTSFLKAQAPLPGRTWILGLRTQF
ncbi:MAG: TonB-dependent receptor [Burkholderiales bacterium]|jgi:iron complex outermembrane receptor protein|nr:TonB-dependent receptor [Burkholderiales bacterium]MCA3161771.1 TonB-dependent receptor [Burkholderiales bacterium]MCA3163957.1 TonB-dependent receptor [Burkholderiales bacterium]MCA3165258.1 TonB-dependent receptor [Burkholderiales bacterium]MCA3170408.1 TonB-dependent receptor [Burkholderiales bacterium]